VVVEQGGFAQAAAALNRSQSSVSYAVAQLQERLAVPLLATQGRRAVLTEAGRALLSEAIPLIDDLDRLEARGQAIGGGEAVRIRLIVDSLCPKPRLFGALARLAALHPHVQIDLQETVRQATPDPRERTFDLAIAMPDPGLRFGRRIAEIEMIAVASSDHPLHRRGAPLSAATLRRHLRVDISGPQPESGGVIETERRIWLVSTVEAALAAVEQGLAFGWLPLPMIMEGLEAGRLAALPLLAGSTRSVPLDLSFADEERATPAVHKLARFLLGEEV
jgi:DNA-binding transcriptional LysR family regulator